MIWSINIDRFAVKIVSATLVHIPGNSSIMLDAGEGTLGQMMRIFGRERMDLELQRISCIFISHLHADHHLGVIQLLKRWYHVMFEFLW